MSTHPTLADLADEATWLEWRARAFETTKPLRITEMMTTEQTREEFIEGARLLRLDKITRAGDGGSGPSPIQLAIADVINAGRPINGILEPRRTTKTTAIQVIALGRCALRDDYRVGWTMATTGAKAGELFRSEIVAPIERLYAGRTLPFIINTGKGTEHIRWPNGSRFAVYAPGGDGFRGGGFDLTVIDEGGEAEVDLSTDLTASVLPTMDTKPGAQFVVAGTAADYRDGNILWDTLTDPDAAVIQHAIPDATDPEEMEAWEPDEEHPRARMRDLIIAAHPGISWTTPLDAVARNYRKLPRDKFLREYGGVFGNEGTATGLIPQPHLERAGLPDRLPAPPDTFALALAVHPDGLWASVGVAFHYQPDDDLAQAAWKLDGLGDTRPPVTALALLHHQKGTKGLASRLLVLARRYRVPIIYDQASQAAGVEIEHLARSQPRPTLTPATTVDVRRAATKVLKGFEDQTLVFFREQRTLLDAMETAVKRTIGAAGGFGFGRPRGEFAADITPIEACSLALHYLDDAAAPIKPSAALEFA